MRKFLLPFIALLFATSALAADEAPYVAPDRIDFSHIIAPPPTPGTPAEQRDIAAVLEAQANASDAERARAIADAEISPYTFADVLGPKFQARRLPITTAFFDRVMRTAAPLYGAGKVYWHHDRPFVMDTNVRSPDEMVKGVCNTKPGPGSPAVPLCPNGVNYSYPSGHSIFGTLVGILLGEMVPEKRDALLARGRLYGESRVINGVHFPTDIEAGRIEAGVIFVLMMENERFRADLAEARAELRRVLGLGQ